MGNIEAVRVVREVKDSEEDLVFLQWMKGVFFEFEDGTWTGEDEQVGWFVG